MSWSGRRAARCSSDWKKVSSVMDPMDIDTERIDDAVLGLLYLTLHEECRAWKSFDWDALSRLHEKGLIQDPVNKAKSVVLTPTGVEEAERLFNKLFCRS